MGKYDFLCFVATWKRAFVDFFSSFQSKISALRGKLLFVFTLKNSRRIVKTEKAKITFGFVASFVNWCRWLGEHVDVVSTYCSKAHWVLVTPTYPSCDVHFYNPSKRNSTVAHFYSRLFPCNTHVRLNRTMIKRLCFLTCRVRSLRQL